MRIGDSRAGWCLEAVLRAAVRCDVGGMSGTPPERSGGACGKGAGDRSGCPVRERRAARRANEKGTRGGCPSSSCLLGTFRCLLQVLAPPGPPRRARAQEVHADVLMLVDERHKNPFDVEFLLNDRSNGVRIRILADTMFAIIVRFDVKRHQANPPE